MHSRLDLQNLLEELTGSRNVYYNAPPSMHMEYDAILYSRKDITAKFADNMMYNKMNCYEIIVISRLPDSEWVDKLLMLPYCSFDRHYRADNLYHDVLTLYY